MVTNGPSGNHTPVQLVVTEAVELELDTPEGAETYITRVADLREELVTVEAPLRKLDMVPIPVGSQIRLRVARQSAVFWAWAAVEAVRWLPIMALDLRVSSEWTRHQRRASVRLDIWIEPDLAELVLPDGKSIPLDFRIRNLSAGGALLVSKRYLQGAKTEVPPFDAKYLRRHLRDAYIRVQVCLWEGTSLKAKGLIVRLEEVDEGREYYFRVSVRFVDLSRREEDIIFRYIFEEQRKRRRAGL